LKVKSKELLLSQPPFGNLLEFSSPLLKTEKFFLIKKRSTAFEERSREGV